MLNHRESSRSVHHRPVERNRTEDRDTLEQVAESSTSPRPPIQGKRAQGSTGVTRRGGTEWSTPQALTPVRTGPRFRQGGRSVLCYPEFACCEVVRLDRDATEIAIRPECNARVKFGHVDGWPVWVWTP